MSPRSKQQLEEVREATRVKIFQAALELFGKKGFSSTSITDIVNAAGISKGLVYHYFESKEDLLKKMIENFERNEMEIMQHIVSDDPKVMLQNILKYLFKEMRENWSFWRLLTNITLQIENFGFVHDIATKKIRTYLEMLEELFANLGYHDPKGEAMILAAVIDGIGLQYYVLKEDYHLDEIEQALITKYSK